jgi:hypothetical protein
MGQVAFGLIEIELSKEGWNAMKLHKNGLLIYHTVYIEISAEEIENAKKACDETRIIKSYCYRNNSV